MTTTQIERLMKARRMKEKESWYAKNILFYAATGYEHQGKRSTNNKDNL